MDDDDYWNTSETKAKALSFDDDVVSEIFILIVCFGTRNYLFR